MNDIHDLINQAHDDAIKEARQWLANEDAVILDTETTGLGNDAEVVQIAVIDIAGVILLNTLVKPTTNIPADATAIHHITDDQVANAPSYAEILPKLAEVLGGKTCIIYNRDYDTRILWQSGRKHNLPEMELAENWACAMWIYAAYYGDWNDYRGNFRWQKLGGGDHSALGDCYATLDLIFDMATSHLIDCQCRRCQKREMQGA